MNTFAKDTQTSLPEVDYVVVDLECHGLRAAVDAEVDVYFAVTISVTGSSKPSLRVWHNMEELVSVLNTQCAFGTSLVYHNAKFDHNVLLLRGLSVPWSQVVCTQVLAYLRNNQAPSFSLDALTGKKQDLLPFALEEGFASLSDFWNTNHSANEGVLRRLEDYCKADTKACHGLYVNLVKDLSLCPSVVSAYYNLEQPLLPILSQLEREGVQIDKPLLLASVDDFAAEVAELTDSIATLVGRLPKLQWQNDEFVPVTKWYGKASLKTPATDLPVYVNKLHVPPFYTDAEGVAVQNWSGHKLGLAPQVVGSHCPLVPFNANAATGHVYWVIKNTCPEALEDIGTTKTGKPQVNKDFVADVAELLPDDFPIGRLAKVVKRQQMALGILKHLSEDGRLRAQFNHTRTLTGRLATSNPNLQNMERAGADESSQLFRKLFIAKPGYVLLCADLAAIELRTLAHYLSVCKGDTGLKEEFNSANPDAHTTNASKWGVTRTVAKTLIFLLIYGGQPKLMFQRKLFPTLAKAKAAFNGVEKAQPAIKELMQDVIKLSTKRGFVKSLGGRHMHYPNLRSSNKWDKMKAERQCFNALIQGSARDIIHRLAIETAPAVWSHGGSFVNIVHDEVLIEVPEENASALIAELTPIWHNRLDILDGVPVNGDWNKGSTWYEAK